MQSRRFVAPLAALALTAPLAHGQTPEAPAPDALCAGIAHVVKTADEERPFVSLVPPGQSLGSLPRLNQSPAGFADFRGCQLYRAGNAKEGVNGGGPYNYVRCNMLYESVTQMTDKAAVVKDSAMAAYDRLSVRARACLEPSGWTAPDGERKRKYEDYETALVFSRAGNVNEVVVSLKEDNSSPGSRSNATDWSVDITIRNPNPKHPKPQE